MSATIAVMATYVEDREEFDRIDFGHRRYSAMGYEEFPARSGQFPHRVLKDATKINLGMVEAEPQTDHDKNQTVRAFIVVWDKVEKLIPKLEALVETNADATAGALVKHGGEGSDLGQVAEALRTGAWPEGNNPAVEAAAFANQLLKYARMAVGGMGVCCEYTGDFPGEKPSA